jgi:hypothetical protein
LQGSAQVSRVDEGRNRQIKRVADDGPGVRGGEPIIR